MFRTSLLLLLASSSQAFGTSFSFDPNPVDIRSPNGAYILTLRKSGIHTVYSAADKSTPLWSLHRAIFIQPVDLSNDGSTVAIAAFSGVSETEFPSAIAIEFWSKAGMIRSYRVQELCPDPETPEKTGWYPTGWRAQFPLTWMKHLETDGEFLTLTTSDRNEYQFRLSDGEIISRRNLKNLWVVGPTHEILVLGACLVVVLALICWLERKRAARTALTPSPQSALPARTP
jgi:hypothetical protein